MSIVETRPDWIEQDKPLKIWTCKIGECPDGTVPPGADAPMREAVRRAYREITGREPGFIFSGWGGELDEGERAVVENRLPRDPMEGRDPLDGENQF